MQLRSRSTCLVLLLGMTFLSPGGAQQAEKFVPQGPGVIDGRVALTVLPAVYEGRQFVENTDPAGVEVHLVSADDAGEELVYPAGVWVQPPPGRYRMWLQGGWRMTPYSRVIIWGAPAAKPGERAGMVSDEVLGPAGRVRLPSDLETLPGLELHLLHAGDYLAAEEFARWEISLRRPVSEVGDGVLMPAGKAVGALWDRKGRRYVAISRPFDVREGRTVEIPLQRPGDGADLVAQVARRGLALRAGDMEVNLVVQQQGMQRAPDLTVFTTDRAYGFWYGLPPGPAELKGENQQDVIPSQKLELQAGKIERITAEMKPRPALDVQLDVPSALMHAKPVLEIRRLPAGEVLEHRTLRPEANIQRFDNMPATLLQVELQTAVGAFAKQVDLSSGQDGFLLLKPEMITLTGRVFLGDDGHAAELTFANAARELKVASADDGRYEAVFLEPVQTVAIRLDGSEKEPYFDFFRPAIALSQELDFHLADGDFRVRVLDARTGKGIAKATVEIRNNYLPKEAKEGSIGNDRPGARRDRAVFQMVKTGDDGEARLPPLRPGSIEMRASAEGYVKTREVTKADLPDENGEQTFELRLDPAGETLPVRLHLSNGNPASGAQVLLLRSLVGEEEIFSGRADTEGVVQVPRKLAGVLLIRHPAAASSIKDWQSRSGEPEEDGFHWTLSSAAERPLTIHVKDAKEKAVGRADLVLWLDGWRLSGLSLAWLTGGASATDANGFWTGNNLPRATLSVLVQDPESRTGGVGGVLDSRGTLIGYPWVSPVEIRVAE